MPGKPKHRHQWQIWNIQAGFPDRRGRVTETTNWHCADEAGVRLCRKTRTTRKKIKTRAPVSMRPGK